MALFEVPGWTVPDAPVAQSSNPKKRKRPSSGDPSSSKIRSATQNVEKLFASLGSEHDDSKKVQKKQKNPRERRRDAHEARGAALKSPSKERDQAKPRHKQADAGSRGPKVQDRKSANQKEDAARPAKKHQKTKGGEKPTPKVQQSPVPPEAGPSKKGKKEEGLTELQANMKHSLDGARFRFINETLYKSDSSTAHDMMRENPEVFSEYHSGFRHQTHSWPDNPVSQYITSLSSHSPGTVIVDLGCGDAALAKALVPKGFVVLSYDLVSDGEYVIEADICQRIPLPGSEDEEKTDSAQVADVVVCALSLMSTNWVSCVREAWRILKSKGELRIAEVSSRFTDMEAFVSVICAVGFKLRSKDESNTHFTLFEFVKVARKPKNAKEWEKLVTRGSILKPCEYKRR
ncbi:hypothetical protein BDW22DRAFT_528534 [Trametopsis cervina]|nr:hypothetical protein BDW22DRAFT_528534 [Trametopsis cervina]